jgi:maltooligosyltrehalose synthase
MITACGLRLRHSWPDVFAQGAYLPLEATGEMANHVVAVARHLRGHVIIAIVPRLVAGLARSTADQDGRTDFQPVPQWLPIGSTTWRATKLIFPASFWQGLSDNVPTAFRDIITGQLVSLTDSPDRSDTTSILLSNALSTCPVALLEGGNPGGGSGFQS